MEPWLPRRTELKCNVWHFPGQDLHYLSLGAYHGRTALCLHNDLGPVFCSHPGPPQLNPSFGYPRGLYCPLIQCSQYPGPGCGQHNPSQGRVNTGAWHSAPGLGMRRSVQTQGGREAYRGPHANLEQDGQSSAITDGTQPPSEGAAE